jgi:hypothetical protein
MEDAYNVIREYETAQKMTNRAQEELDKEKQKLEKAENALIELLKEHPYIEHNKEVWMLHNGVFILHRPIKDSFSIKLTKSDTEKPNTDVEEINKSSDENESQF